MNNKSFLEKVDTFRLERVDILQKTMRSQMYPQPPEAILHIIPNESFGQKYRLNDFEPITKNLTSSLQIAYSDKLLNWEWEYCFDGVQCAQLRAAPFRPDMSKTREKVIQIFRDGSIEEFSIVPTTGLTSGQKNIDSAKFEWNLQNALSSYLKLLNGVGFSSVVLLLTIIGCKDFCLSCPAREQHSDRNDMRVKKTDPILTNAVYLPAFTVDNKLDLKDTKTALKLLSQPLTILWQSVNKPRSPYIGQAGVWTGPDVKIKVN